MNSEELLIDDSEFPVYHPVVEWTRKFEEAQHRRDRQGRFADKASVRVAGRQVAVVKPERARRAGDKLVPISVTAFDEAFARETGFYLGVGGQGGIGTRYERFGQFIAEHDSVEAAEVYVSETGRVGFTNGRHRYAWLRDQGLTEIPVAMTPESVEHAKKLGLLAAVKRAWDESRHPRDKEGQFTESGQGTTGAWPTDDKGRFIAYHGTMADFSAFDEGKIGSRTDSGFFGRGIYFTKDTEQASKGKWTYRAGAPTVVLEARVDIKNPFHATADDMIVNNPERAAERTAELQAQGYDGIITENGWLVAFKATQVTIVEKTRHDRPPTEEEARAERTRQFFAQLRAKAQKGEHDYGNTQIQIAPTSSAAASLNMARDAIRDEDCMGTGKDVDPNHLTVRYGLLNDDLDRLRSFIAAQEPFEAHLMGIELFPASEHSEGAVPVVARIASPELHTIENAIGDHADFKEKSFPVYKPHCTLAYCKPEAAESYQDLFVHGSFVVQSITISHQSGVQETIPFGMVQKWDEDLHPRDAQGQFTENRERKEFVEAAIRRGEAHTVSEDEFVSYHFTGHIPSNAYEKYEAGEMDFIHRKDFDTLLDTREVNGQTVEIRLQTETPTYTKWTGDAPKAERDRLYEEYEQEAKRLGTTPMMAGIDLGWGSPAYESLKEFERRYFASGSHAVRDEQGNAVQLTPEEVKAKGLPTESYTVGAFIGDKAVGYAGDEFGASGVYVARTVQRHGIGLTLLKTYLEKSGRLAKGRSFGQMTGVGQGLVRALHRQLVKEAAAKKKDPVSGRYVTPFVSFDKQGDEQLRMIASLNSSRLATWGFTAEAEVLGMARYKLTAVLDGRTSKFCRLVAHNKIFEVPDARRKVIEVLNVQDPEDLRTVQPWPKQTKQALAEFAEMTPAELTARGLHIPPYHPHCRTICRAIPSSVGKTTEVVPTIPVETEAFQAVTAADLKELGLDATQEQVDQWNAHVGMTPVELLSKLSGLPPREVMTKPLGVGTNPITFADDNIGFNVRGSSPSGVEFKLGAILEPFTGTYYLTQADLLAGNPKAEMAFLKQMFWSLIDMGLKSSATSVAVGVAGNAPYYARLGFLPDELEWDSLRLYALEGHSRIPEVLASLAPEDALLVKHLLQDKSVSAMTALVELPFTYQGKTIGEWLFGEAGGVWSLDLTDELLVAQAKAYLS